MIRKLFGGFVLLLVVIALALLVASCTTDCVSGKVISKSESDGRYYLSIATYSEPLVFSGEVVSVEVDQSFYFNSSVNGAVTVCE